MYAFFHVRAWLEINLSSLVIFMTPDHPRQVIHKIIYEIHFYDFVTCTFMHECSHISLTFTNKNLVKIFSAFFNRKLK